MALASALSRHGQPDARRSETEARARWSISPRNVPNRTVVPRGGKRMEHDNGLACSRLRCLASEFASNRSPHKAASQSSDLRLTSPLSRREVSVHKKTQLASCCCAKSLRKVRKRTNLPRAARQRLKQCGRAFLPAASNSVSGMSKEGIACAAIAWCLACANPAEKNQKHLWTVVVSARRGVCERMKPHRKCGGATLSRWIIRRA